MIRYALMCGCGFEFEAWFGDSADFDAQSERGLVSCPDCGGADVRKQIMAPAVAGRSEDSDPAEDAAKFEDFAAQVRKRIAETHDNVGDKFPDVARAMHRGETEHKPIYGQASKADAEALADEGAPVAPLPEPFVPKDPKKLN